MRGWTKQTEKKKKKQGAGESESAGLAQEEGVDLCRRLRRLRRRNRFPFLLFASDGGQSCLFAFTLPCAVCFSTLSVTSMRQNLGALWASARAQMKWSLSYLEFCALLFWAAVHFFSQKNKTKTLLQIWNFKLDLSSALSCFALSVRNYIFILAVINTRFLQHILFLSRFLKL
jgi:hypothetical protein